MRLTLFFDPPYWVGLLEVERDHVLYAARHIFGAEPGDQEVYEFVQRDLLTLQKQMTIGIAIEVPLNEQPEHHANPKRVQREVRRQLAQQGASTKAQDATRVQIEQNKHEVETLTRQRRDQLREYKREIARARAKARHRGR